MQFAEFLTRAVPLGVALIISSQVVMLIGTFQEAVINPSLGLALGRIDLDDREYKVNEDVSFKYGRLIAATINFAVVMFVGYLMTIAALKHGIKA